MKRDPELLRKLLLEMEEDSSDTFIVVNALGMSDEGLRRWHHIKLLCDENLVEQTGNHAFRLTSEGHDFLEATRDEKRWREVLAKTSGGWTLDMLKQLAIQLLKRTIE